MAWKTIVPRGRHLPRLNDRVAIGFYKAADHPVLVVKIGDPLLDILHWARGAEVQLMFGIGEHRGKLRIIEKMPGFQLIQGGIRARHLVIRTRKMPSEASKGSFLAQICPHELCDGGLEVTLPDWFYRSYEDDPRAARLTAVKSHAAG